VALKRFNKWVYASILLLLTSVISTVYGPGLVYAGSVPTSCPAYTQHDKAILVGIDILVRGLAVPSFSDLKRAGFTLVGTYPESGSSSEWNTIAAWIKTAKAAGLRTFVQAGPYPQPTLKATVKVGIDSTKKAASIGADVVELDEFLTCPSCSSISKSQFLSIVRAGLSVNPRLQFIATDWSQQALNTLFSWTADYPCARVANDNYNNKGMVDLDSQLSSQYGKAAITWLIFSKGSQDFDCYVNLNVWITYVKQKNIDALFYWVDPAGTWQTQWSTVATF
jgi:hypothetical protein